MYICLCHGITSGKVNEAINSGLVNSGNVHEYFNCKPKCGKCLEYIFQMLENKSDSSVANIRSGISGNSQI